MPASDPVAPPPAPDARGDRTAGSSGAEPTAAELTAIRDRSERAAARNDATMTRAVLIAIGAGLALDALAVVAALLLGGPGAVLGALVGTGLALVVTLPTLISARVGMRQGPAAMAGVVLGTWLAKMVVLIGVLLWVRTLGSIALPWTGYALLVGAVAPAVVEAVLLLRSRPRLEVR